MLWHIDLPSLVSGRSLIKDFINIFVFQLVLFFCLKHVRDTSQCQRSCKIIIRRYVAITARGILNPSWPEPGEALRDWGIKIFLSFYTAFQKCQITRKNTANISLKFTKKIILKRKINEMEKFFFKVQDCKCTSL